MKRRTAFTIQVFISKVVKPKTKSEVGVIVHIVSGNQLMLAITTLKTPLRIASVAISRGI
jgi:hypothetical protein